MTRTEEEMSPEMARTDGNHSVTWRLRGLMLDSGDSLNKSQEKRDRGTYSSLASAKLTPCHST